MTVQRAIGGLIAALSLTLALGVPASAMAQTAVTTADIQRLQDEVYQASNDVSRLRTSDALQAGRLQDELDLLREDVIYLKVKLRKESSVSRTRVHPASRPASGPALACSRGDACVDAAGEHQQPDNRRPAG